MNYTVQWVDDAILLLLEITRQSGDSAAVLAAVDEVNQSLSEAPESSEAECYEGLWRRSVGRLRVMYEINHATRVIRIVALRLLPV
jgi:hypothetical protein